MMDVKDFKSLILNQIERKPEVKSKVLKAVLKGHYRGYISSDFVTSSHLTQSAMQQLISEGKIIFIPKEPLRIKK